MSRFPVPVQVAGLIAWLCLVFVAAAIGAVASINAAEFYTQLQRPDWAPPPWLFGPVWTALYALMGIAAWLVWRIDGFRAARTALLLFLVQLAVNALWSWLFFAWRLGGPAFLDALLLCGLVVATLLHFRRHQPLAALLLTPYLLWVAFAVLLNFTVWQLNPQSL